MTRTARFMHCVDDVVIRITDHMPSTRFLMSVLGVSMLALLLLAVTGSRPHGVRTPIESESPVTASSAVDASAALPTPATPVAPTRLEPAVAAAAIVPPPMSSDMPVRVTTAAAPIVEPAQPVQRIEIKRGDAPPRVIDMTRSESPSTRAAEILRAEPLPPRVADAPRLEPAVGATSRAAVENTLSSGVVRSRDVAAELTPAREESPKPSIEIRPAAEPAPASGTAGGSLTGL